METFNNITLALHVTAGFTALLTGFIAIIGKKGTPFHKTIGRIFFYSMLGVSVFGFTVAYSKGNLFLQFIAIFALYTNLNGYRATKNKSLKPKFVDWIILFMGAINGALMVSTFNIVLLVFGSLSLLLVIGDLNKFRKIFRGKELAKNEWMRQHIGMMIGTYIATITAFILVNLKNFDPYWLPWLAPTAIGIPLLYFMQRKHAPAIRKSSKATMVVMLALLGTFSSYAQPYVEGGNTRHRFAQLHIGTALNSTLFDQGTLFKTDENAVDWPASYVPASSNLNVKIGGLHFWGHADFFIAFSVHSFGQSDYRTGVETGALYYPFQLKNGKVRPYVGISFIGQSYRHGEGAVLSEIKFPVKAGISFLYKQHYFLAGFNYIAQQNNLYYYQPDLAKQIQLPQWSFTLGYAFTIETTLSAEKGWQSGRTEAITNQLARQKKLNGFTLGIGISSAFALRQSENYAFLDNQYGMPLFPEFAAGYYLHKPDIQLNASFRKMKSKQEAYGLTQTVKRTAYTLEAYKFFADYHGFAPFIGPTLSYEVLRVSNQKEGQTAHFTASGVKPGIVFGWDIRPNRLQAWYLRTNIRWCPDLHVATTTGIYHLDNLEINFFQLVVFPGRLF